MPDYYKRGREVGCDLPEKAEEAIDFFKQQPHRF